MALKNTDTDLEVVYTLFFLGCCVRSFSFRFFPIRLCMYGEYTEI